MGSVGFGQEESTCLRRHGHQSYQLAISAPSSIGVKRVHVPYVQFPPIRIVYAIQYKCWISSTAGNQIRGIPPQAFD